MPRLTSGALSPGSRLVLFVYYLHERAESEDDRAALGRNRREDEALAPFDVDSPAK